MAKFLMRIIAVANSGAAFARAEAASTQVTPRRTERDREYISCRAVGLADAPADLLLHGLPSSSLMFEPKFAHRPDYDFPLVHGYLECGPPDASGARAFGDTGDGIAAVVQRIADESPVARCANYRRECGGTPGSRLVVVRPACDHACLIQNPVALDDGLEPPWATRRASRTNWRVNETVVRESAACWTVGRSESGSDQRRALPVLEQSVPVRAVRVARSVC